MDNRTDGSLISREASTGFKGLLILLIILGHNHFACTDIYGSGDKNELFRWLYSFHVNCFLLLPFLYGSKPITGKRVWKDFVKLYIPYLWVFVLCAVVYALLNKNVSGIGDYANAFIMGNEPMLKDAIGFSFPWFLPTMFALLVVKGVYDWGSRWVKIGLLVISTTLWVLIISGVTTRYEIGNYVPLAISQAFIFLPMGVIVSVIIKFSRGKGNLIWFLLFALLSAMYLLLFDTQYDTLRTILQFVLPIVAFVALYGISNYLGRSKFMRLLGDYSLQIYLIHTFIFNALMILAMRFAINQIAGAIITYILTLGITLILALLIKRWKWLYRILFP